MTAIASWCRHCGSLGALTVEHLPPRAAGNDSEVSIAKGFDEGFALHEVLDAIHHWPEGHTVPTLCSPCNNKASKWNYVKEYVRWHEFFLAEARTRVAASGYANDPFKTEVVWDVELPYDMQPRRFIGQFLGMLFAVQRHHLFWVRHEQLRAAIGSALPNDPKNPPGPVELAPVRAFLSLANRNIFYSRDEVWAVEISLPGQRPSGLVLPAAATRSVPFELLVFAPFAFTLTPDGQKPPWPALDITHWSRLGHQARLKPHQRRLRIPTMPETAPFP